MSPDDVALLVSPAGMRALTRAATLDLTPDGRLRSLLVLREAVGEPLATLVLDQALLRASAAAKHPRAGELLWTREALEQATASPVAEHRARRYAGAAHVVDVGCSVGGDLVALAAVAQRVTGLELDPVRAAMAAANASALGYDARVEVRCGDAMTWQPEPTDLVFVDPARRSGGQRRFDPAQWRPPLTTVASWAERAAGLGAKVAPGIDYDALPWDVEVELVSLRNEVREAVLWWGALRTPAARRATVLPSGEALTSDDPESDAVSDVGRYLLDPDGAVVRAGLVRQLAAHARAARVDERIAYLTSDTPYEGPLARCLEVLDVLPFSLKSLREALRSHGAGGVVVMKRGSAVDVDDLRRRLALRGAGPELTVVLTRIGTRPIAVVARPLPS